MGKTSIVDADEANEGCLLTVPSYTVPSALGTNSPTPTSPLLADMEQLCVLF